MSETQNTRYCQHRTGALTVNFYVFQEQGESY